MKSQLADSFHEQNRDWLSEMRSRLNEHIFLIFGSILLCLLLLSIACDHVFGSVEADASAVTAAVSPAEALASVNAEAGAQTTAGPQAGADIRFFLSPLFAEGLGQEFSSRGWSATVGTLGFRLTLSALLGSLVAFRPRRSGSFQRNPYVVQTQILLTVVACALMMIVGDSAARAFGIFAAASLVRFRTNIRDPKEITVLLINLGVGLAAGVGRWELATMFTLFVLVLLRILEAYEARQAFRVMDLSVKTHDLEATDEAVRELFRRHNLDVDIRELNKESAKRPIGKVVYSVGIGPRLSTDRLAEEIYLADPVNIDRVEWHRKKTPSYT